jgi:mono/diheme cytochrome c family protein
VPALLELLGLPEERTRSRALRELRGRPPADVVPAVRRWAGGLVETDPAHDRLLLAALWVTWGQHQVDRTLLERCLTAPSHHIRAAAVEVIRHEFRQIPDHVALLQRAAGDPHGRVRLAAIVAASWVGGAGGAQVVVEALRYPLDHWMQKAALYAFIPLKAEVARLVAAPGTETGETADAYAHALLAQDPDFDSLPSPEVNAVPSGIARRLGATGVDAWTLGRNVYFRDGHCVTCHQPAGEGVEKIYPPLAGSEWIEDEARLVKLVLHGLTGDLMVKGERYFETTTPPMPGFAGLLNDREIAALVTYVRNAFGSPAPVTTPETVRSWREATAGQATFYRVEELLQQHPLVP